MDLYWLLKKTYVLYIPPKAEIERLRDNYKSLLERIVCQEGDRECQSFRKSLEFLYNLSEYLLKNYEEYDRAYRILDYMRAKYLFGLSFE